MTFPKGLRLLLKVPLNPTPTNKTVDKITTLYKKKKKRENNRQEMCSFLGFTLQHLERISATPSHFLFIFVPLLYIVS